MEKDSNLFIKNEAWYHSLFETSKDGILIIDQVTGNIVDANSSACLLYGFTKEEFVGMKKTDISLEPDKTSKTLTESITDIPIRYHCKKDGTKFPVEITRSFFTKADRKYLTAFIRDLTNRFNSEAALRISEAQLSNAMKIAHLGHWEYDVVNDVFTFNDNFYAVFHTNAEQVGKYSMSSAEYVKKFVHPDDFTIVGIETQKAIQSTDPHYTRYIEHKCIFADCTPGYVAVRFSIIKDDNGKTMKTFGVNQDITERKQAEEKLAYQAKLLARVHDAIVATDDKMRITYWNKTAEEIFGWAEEEILGVNIEELFHTQENNLSHHETLTILMQTGHYEGEAKYYCKNGNYILAQVKSSALKGQHGEFAGLVTSIQDITERKHMEETLQEERTLLRTIVDNLPIALYIKDKEARKVLCNPMDQKNIGKPESEIIGKTDSDFFIKEIADQTLADDFNVLKTGEPVISREEHIINALGRSIWLFTSKIPRRNQSGEVIGIIGMGLDITERKKTEEELIKAKEKAEESDKLKTAFLCNMSHEIRTPMNAILGFSEFLTRPGISENKKARFTKLIKERTHDLLGIIEDILDISKIEIGQMTLMETSVNIKTLLENLYEYYLVRKDILKPGSDIELVLNLDSKLNNLSIQADEARLKQILMNLLENSFKFTDKGSIELACKLTSDKKLLFRVSDTGIGIPKDKQTIIFDRFRQVEDIPETRRFGGTGLGLSIAKGLSDLMGGKIWLESEVDKGTLFYFSVPYKHTDKHASKISLPEEQTAPSWKNKTFLIVEDDPSNAEILNEMIATTHGKAINAKTGNDAVKLFTKNTNIDLVLLDIRLPDASGLDIVRVLKTFRPHIPIIAQTAYASNTDYKDCMDAGCNGYISKPIQYDKLIEIVTKFI